MKLKFINDIMVFLKVVEHHSVTAAARELNVSKSNVSKYLARLEETLGTQLLRRSTRKISLTEAGRMLYQQCSNIERDLKEAEAAVTHMQGAPTGSLRVAAPAGFSTHHLTPAINDFLKTYDDIKVEVCIGKQDEELIGHHIDLAIRMGKLPDSSLIARKLASRPMRVCASPEYLAKHGTPKHPRELANHNCLIYQGSPTGDEWHFAKGGENLHLPIKGNFICDNSQSLEQAAIEGLGIVMLPGYMMINDVKSGRLVSILQEFLPATIDIQVVYPQMRYVPPKVRVFIDFLLQRFQPNYWQVDNNS